MRGGRIHTLEPQPTVVAAKKKLSFLEMMAAKKHSAPADGAPAAASEPEAAATSPSGGGGGGALDEEHVVGILQARRLAQEEGGLEGQEAFLSADAAARGGLPRPHTRTFSARYGGGRRARSIGGRLRGMLSCTTHKRQTTPLAPAGGGALRLPARAAAGAVRPRLAAIDASYGGWRI